MRAALCEWRGPGVRARRLYLSRYSLRARATRFSTFISTVVLCGALDLEFPALSADEDSGSVPRSNPGAPLIPML